MEEQLRTMQMDAFNDVLSSDSPAPGGGGAAAEAGAMGAALTAMVCRLTLNRPKYAAEQDFALETANSSDKIRKQLQDAIDGDAEVFFRLSDALKLPKATEDEKLARTLAVQGCLKACTEMPLKVMRLAAEQIELTKAAVGRTNTSAVSDLGAAASLLKSCAETAWLNVLINIGSIRDEAFNAAARKEGEALLLKVRTSADDVYGRVTAQLS